MVYTFTGCGQLAIAHVEHTEAVEDFTVTGVRGFELLEHATGIAGAAGLEPLHCLLERTLRVVHRLARDHGDGRHGHDGEPDRAHVFIIYLQMVCCRMVVSSMGGALGSREGGNAPIHRPLLALVFGDLPEWGT